MIKKDGKMRWKSNLKRLLANILKRIFGDILHSIVRDIEEKNTASRQINNKEIKVFTTTYACQLKKK